MGGAALVESGWWALEAAGRGDMCIPRHCSACGPDAWVCLWGASAAPTHGVQDCGDVGGVDAVHIKRRQRGAALRRARRRAVDAHTVDRPQLQRWEGKREGGRVRGQSRWVPPATAGSAVPRQKHTAAASAGLAHLGGRLPLSSQPPPPPRAAATPPTPIPPTPTPPARTGTRPAPARAPPQPPFPAPTCSRTQPPAQWPQQWPGYPPQSAREALRREQGCRVGGAGSAARRACW